MNFEESKEAICKLIDALAFVKSKELKQIFVDNYVAECGPIPEEYKDAVDAMIDL